MGKCTRLPRDPQAFNVCIPENVVSILCLGAEKLLEQGNYIHGNGETGNACDQNQADGCDHDSHPLALKSLPEVSKGGCPCPSRGEGAA
jgi:hypothetical protein